MTEFETRLQRVRKEQTIQNGWLKLNTDHPNADRILKLLHTNKLLVDNLHDHMKDWVQTIKEMRMPILIEECIRLKIRFVDEADARKKVAELLLDELLSKTDLEKGEHLRRVGGCPHDEEIFDQMDENFIEIESLKLLTL